ncbi:MAG: PorT family protein [Prevotellaceae bacterium]|nr:PorT family protein [Prevotellaceae bacterium]
MELPPDDWDVLVSKMEQKHRRVIPLWWFAAAGIAVLLCLGGLIGLYNTHSSKKLVAEQKVHPKTENACASNRNNSSTDKESCLKNEETAVDKIKFVVPKILDFIADNSNCSDETNDNEQISHISISDAYFDNSDGQHESVKQKLSVEEAEELILKENQKATERIKTPNKNRDKYYASLLSSASPAGFKVSPDKPGRMGIIKSPNGEASLATSYSDSKHDLPLSFGLNIGIPLAKRLFLNTGLQYTFLHSKISNYYMETGKLYSTDDQFLHYLGIPAMLSYRFVDGGVVKVYASVGSIAEKGLLETHKNRTVLQDVQPQDTPNKTIGGFQFSLNANVGISVKLFSSLYLFVEPGFAWYIPATKYVQPRSKRTENPFFMNLTGGLRFDL